jgi:hypothetical protein
VERPLERPHAVLEIHDKQFLRSPADHLMAQAIHIVAGLYHDGVLPKP